MIHSRLKPIQDQLSRKQLAQFLSSLYLGISVSPTFGDGASAKLKRKVVRVYLPGGMSHIDSWDPKPENPSIMGNTKIIHGNTGEQISHFFPQMAKCMDQFCLVRSMKSPEGDHTRGMYLTRTSYPKLGTINHPDFGAFLQALLGSKNSALPATVNLNKGASSGFLSSQYDPLPITSAKDPLKDLVMKEPGSEQNQKFMKLARDLQNDFHQQYKFKNIRNYAYLYNDAMTLLNSEELEAFNVSEDPDYKKSRYNFELGPHVILIRKLLQHNVQCINLTIGNWDHHSDIWEGYFPKSSKKLDQFMATLLQDLKQYGLFDHTIVTCMSEFGRTPKITKEKGRDHHNKSYTALIAGAGVKNGTVYGKTDEAAGKVLTPSVSPMDLNATVAKLLGADLNKEIYSPDNRPFTICRGGTPVQGIIV